VAAGEGAPDRGTATYPRGVSGQDPGEPPEDFQRAVAALRSARLRPEVVLQEAPAPQRLAPWAVALTADVLPPDGGGEAEPEELGTGRFVLLYDPDGHDSWDGVFRVVTFVRAAVEPDVAGDPMLPSVGWSWLVEALEAHQADYAQPSGTVTRVASESFGSLSDRPPSAELEIRASWTAADPELGPHLQAWGDLLATAAGLPPLAAGVVALSRLRRAR